MTSVTIGKTTTGANERYWAPIQHVPIAQRTGASADR